MIPEINPQEYTKAQTAAEVMRAQLFKRLKGKLSDGFSCGCGACKVGKSKVIGIDVPTQYEYQIAMWLMWTCQMEDVHGKKWSQGISRYIPWLELYPMFRNHFAGIEIPVDRPYAQAYHTAETFRPSGREVVVEQAMPAFVRPKGELTNSAWTHAELRIDSNLPKYGTKDALVCCNVDALEFDQERGRGKGQYYEPIAGNHYFHIRIAGEYFGADTYLPIARLDALTKSGMAVYELDETVEEFRPTKK